METLATTNYDMFIFRSDNRPCYESHVQALIRSIASHNLLKLKPICVNENMEVIDGQHRLRAAEKLQVPIYYQIKNDIRSDDVILMNVAKTWSNADYMNYFVKNNYPEYVKLDRFIKENELTGRVALHLVIGGSKDMLNAFRAGKMQFKEEASAAEIEICKYTIDYIKKMNGYSIYTSNSNFWKALLKVVKHPNFEVDKWKINLERMIAKVGPRTKGQEYLLMFMDIYNWRNNRKILFCGDE